MKTLGVIANTTKPRAAEVLKRIQIKAAELELGLVGDVATAGLLSSLRSLPLADMLQQVDAVMALGGDGTMLRAVREFEGVDKPVIGVNIGGLGFLTSVAEEELDRGLECLATDDFDIAPGAVLSATVERNHEKIACYHALNDVVVTRGPASRPITLDVAVDGRLVTSYLCDGLIVATPAGSTGHALSAGGPILAPQTPAFAICPICPHTLSSRPLVVPDRSRICIVGREIGDEQVLSADGQVGQSLEPGDCVYVRRSDRCARFIRLPGYSYYAVLRQKLHWSGSH